MAEKTSIETLVEALAKMTTAKELLTELVTTQMNMLILRQLTTPEEKNFFLKELVAMAAEENGAYQTSALYSLREYFVHQQNTDIVSICLQRSIASVLESEEEAYDLMQKTETDPGMTAFTNKIVSYTRSTVNAKAAKTSPKH